MESEKTCPKCASFPRMDKVDSMRARIPAVMGNQYGSKISETIGLALEVYRCPQCHFVELYEVSSE
jgi:hypothetical protein